jgi:mono/diheme cytochrome c family protein
MNPRKLFLFILIGLFAAIALLIAGCGPQPLPEEPTAIPTLAPATPPKADTGEKPDLAQQGADVFTAQCSACHSVTAEAKVGPGLAGLFDLDTLPDGNSFSEDNLKDWILNGGGAMPGVSLSDADMEALIAYLKEATVVMGTVPTPAGPSSDQGQVIFSGQCAVCHSLTDEQMVGPGLAGLFDLDTLPDGNAFSEENLKDWILNGGGEMPGFALSEGDMEALILYLKEATVVMGTVPTPTGPTSERGGVIFDGQCASCHSLTDEQMVGPGLAGLFDLDTLPDGNAFSEENLKDWILNGGGGMPGFALSDDDMESLILYLKEETQ